MESSCKNTRNSICLNVTSAQYLANYLCCAASSIQLKYILEKRLTFKLFKFIDLRLTHQIISAIFIAIT